MSTPFRYFSPGLADPYVTCRARISYWRGFASVYRWIRQVIKPASIPARAHLPIGGAA